MWGSHIQKEEKIVYKDIVVTVVAIDAVLKVE